jgi:hypothetical protein
MRQLAAERSVKVSVRFARNQPKSRRSAYGQLKPSGGFAPIPVIHGT